MLGILRRRLRHGACPLTRSFLCIPCKVNVFLSSFAVQIGLEQSYSNYQFVSTWASASELKPPSDALKQVLLAVEDDPIFGKESCRSYIQNLCRSGNLSGASQLLNYLHGKQIFLNIDTYKSLLAAAAEANDFQLSSLVFKDLLLLGTPLDSTCFMNVAKAFQKATNMDPLLHFVREVSELIFPRNATVINRIIDGFAESGQMEKALVIFQDMKNLKCKPDTVTFNIVLDVLGKAGWVDQMLLEFASMKEAGHVPDIITYNTLINSLCKVGRLDLCLIFLREIVERGIDPDLRTYTALINGFGRLGNVEKALELFNEMKRKRLHPSIYVYRALINSLNKAGKFEVAQSLAEEMKMCESKLVGPKDFRKKKR